MVRKEQPRLSASAMARSRKRSGDIVASLPASRISSNFPRIPSFPLSATAHTQYLRLHTTNCPVAQDLSLTNEPNIKRYAKHIVSALPEPPPAPQYRPRQALQGLLWLSMRSIVAAAMTREGGCVHWPCKVRCEAKRCDAMHWGKMCEKQSLHRTIRHAAETDPMLHVQDRTFAMDHGQRRIA